MSIITESAGPPPGSPSNRNESQRQPPEWRILIDQNADDDFIRSPSVVGIFRVPNFLKKSGGEEVYVPQIVSLGPYHHRNAQLHAMNNHKVKAFRRMMRRFELNNYSDNMSFSSRVKEEILRLEGAIRESYEEKIDCEVEDLVSMLCLDGCFILEVLRTLGGDEFPGEGTSNRYEPIFEKDRINYTGLDIVKDILKLENQVPLIVLRKLLQLELNSNDVEEKLFGFLVRSPNKLYPFQYEELNWQPDEQVHHLLGLMHSLIVSAPCPPVAKPADQNRPQPQAAEHLQSLLHGSTVGHPADQTQPHDTHKDKVTRIPRAVKLRNAGIKFKPCNEGIKNIRFEQESSTIYLPPISITDHTEVLFRNLIAMELCKPSEINYVISYVNLMDELIDSDEDVGVLRESEIVTNYHGSDAEVAKLFSVLCSGVTLSRIDAFQQLKRQMYKICRSTFKVRYAEFRKKHCSSFWKCLALFLAILGLLLLALQTVYLIIAFYDCWYCW